jgi:hypothetical protein
MHNRQILSQRQKGGYAASPLRRKAKGKSGEKAPPEGCAYRDAKLFVFAFRLASLAF